MGIKGLTKLLAEHAPKAMKEQKFEIYFGREIAIDASMSIYQFLIVVGRRGTQTLTNEAGEVTSHLQGMLTRTIRLLEAGIKPVYVFDGTPPDLKKQELAKRFLKRLDATKDLNDALKRGKEEDIEKFSKRTVKATDEHYEDCKKLLRLMGVPVIEAPCEAEAQCSALCKAGKVYAVASEDMDSLAFGTPRFLRHLMDPISKKIPVVEFEVSKVLEELNLTMDQFIDLCILSGCDYCESIKGLNSDLPFCRIHVKGRQPWIDIFYVFPISSVMLLFRYKNNSLVCILLNFRFSGIGGLTALKLIRQHGSLEHILDNINKERYHLPFNWPYQETRELFRRPSVLTNVDQLELKWTNPDEEALVRFLVKENTFNRDRITKAIKQTKIAMGRLPGDWLGSSSKPVGTPVPVKVKVTKCSLLAPQRAMKPMMLPLGASGVVCTSFSLVDLRTKHPMKNYKNLCLG